ncbi:MAG TPA: hypothetical protein VFA79_09305 [Myxococcales bacterium]|nr:hypothetical protein [Myxococcales bacterium]
MTKSIVAAALISLASLSAGAGDSLAKFDGGIGVDPVSGIALNSGAPVVNNVRGFFPAGAPWRIGRLEANIRTDGHVRVDGRGLLLAAGSLIGTTAGISVRAVLLCGDPKTSTAHVTDVVALSQAGDFNIEGDLTPPPPAQCDTPAFLIVSGTGGAWLAAGIPDSRG